MTNGNDNFLAAVGKAAGESAKEKSWLSAYNEGFWKGVLDACKELPIYYAAGLVTCAALAWWCKKSNNKGKTTT